MKELSNRRLRRRADTALLAVAGIGLISASLTAPALASPINGQQNLAPGQAFSSACAGSQYFGGIADPGTAVAANLPQSEDSYVNCSTQLNAPVTVSNSGVDPATHSVGFQNSATVSAQVGGITFGATNTGAPIDIFAGAAGSGGWNDSLPVWQGPTGYWMVPIEVNGLLTASGTGEAVLQVAAYSNFNELLGPSFQQFENSNASIAFGAATANFDYEMADWKADSADPNVAANQTIWFAIPVTTGQAVEFGFYANYLVTSGDSAGTAVSTQSIDPPSLSYGGPGYEITDTGSIVSGLTFGTSASGYDYTQAFAPEPSTAWLALASLPLAFFASRLRRRARSTEE